MLTSLFAPYSGAAALALRLALASVLITHGWPKFFGAEGLSGFSGWLGGMGIPMPMVFAFLAALLEVGGGILLILGLATPAVAALLVLEIAFILLYVRSGAPFAHKELDLLVFAIAFALMIMGGGKYSLDNFFGFKL